MKFAFLVIIAKILKVHNRAKCQNLTEAQSDFLMWFPNAAFECSAPFALFS